MVKEGTPPAEGRTVTLGATLLRSLTVKMRFALSVSEVTAVTAIGTSCTRCSHFWAVTMISSRPTLSFCGVDWA